MRALGLCRSGEAEGLAQVAAGPLAVLLGAERPEERLAQALAAQAALPAFLPFSVRHAPGPDAARSLAAQAPERFLAALDRLAGQAEMIVTLQAPPLPETEAGTGRDWLRQRSARHARRESLRRQLTALAPEALLLENNTPDSPPEAALLLPAGAMEARARALRHACPPGLTLTFSGPWPAFAHGAALTREDRRERQSA